MSPPDPLADPYGLVDSPADLRTLVYFGDVDVSSAVVGGQTNSQINAMASASLELNSRSPVVIDIDLTAEVVVARGDRDTGRIFTGFVIEASVDDTVITVTCEGHPALHDPMSGGRVSRTFPVDNIHTLLREGGLPEGRLQLAGLDALPTEIFEAVSSVNGLVLADRITFGKVAFLPAGSATHVLQLLDESENPLLLDFQAAETYAVTYVTAARSYDAEQEAIRRFDGAIAWANVRLRFAGAATPAGEPIDWQRTRLKQLASRAGFIALRGLSTNRSSLHQISPPSLRDLTLTPQGGVTSALIASDSGLSGAVKAAARAISSADPLTAVTAISECLEFYVGATDAGYGFTKAERRAIRRAARDFESDKTRRVEQMIGLLNEAPLMRRLRFQLAEDGVPMTEAEMATIGRVRSQRNDVVHGKTDVVDPADVQRAIALLARILVYSGERRLQRQQLVEAVL